MLSFGQPFEILLVYFFRAPTLEGQGTFFFLGGEGRVVHGATVGYDAKSKTRQHGRLVRDSCDCGVRIRPTILFVSAAFSLESLSPSYLLKICLI